MNRCVTNLIGRSTAWVALVLGLSACESIGILDNDTETWRPAPDQTGRIQAVDLVDRSSTTPEGPDLAMEVLHPESQFCSPFRTPKPRVLVDASGSLHVLTYSKHT